MRVPSVFSRAYLADLAHRLVSEEHGIAPIVVAGIIAGATSLINGILNRNAAKDAATTQATGGQTAIRTLTNAGTASQANLQPWITTGQQANTTLGSLMGLTGVSTGVSGGGSGTATALPTGATGTAVPRVSSAVTDAFVAAHPELVAAQHARLTRDYQTPTGGEPNAAAQAQTASSYVRMQSPTGEVQPVPSGLVSHYTSLGARVVG